MVCDSGNPVVLGVVAGETCTTAVAADGHAMSVIPPVHLAMVDELEICTLDKPMPVFSTVTGLAKAAVPTHNAPTNTNRERKRFIRYSCWVSGY